MPELESATPTAIPTATPTPDTSTQSSAPAESSSNPTGTPQESVGFKQLRETYEALKNKYEPWEKVGFAPEQAQQYAGFYREASQEALGLGQSLGYSQEEVQEAFNISPVRCLNLLRQQAAEAEAQPQQQEPDVQQLIEQRLQEALGPIQERENIRMTDEANMVFERTVHQLATERFKKEGFDYAAVPEDEKFFITSGISELMKYDEQGLRDLKYGGKTAAVQKAANEFFNYWDKAYLARQERGRAKIAPAMKNNPLAPQQAGKPSLQDIIDDPEAIDRVQGRTGASAKYR